MLHDQLSARELQQKTGDDKHCLDGGHSICSCPKYSWYLGVVFYLKVLKNGLMKEEGGKKETFRSQPEKWEDKNRPEHCHPNYFFFPFNRRYSVLFIFLPTLQTSFGSQVCFELLDCLHRFSAYPEDGSLLSALERILPGNICIAGRQKLVGKALAPVAVVVMLQVDMLKLHQNQAYFWYWNFMGIKKPEYWYMTEKLNKHFLRSVN